MMKALKVHYDSFVTFIMCFASCQLFVMCLLILLQWPELKVFMGLSVCTNVNEHLCP